MKKIIVILLSLCVCVFVAALLLLRFLGLSNQLPSSPLVSKITSVPILGKIAGEGDTSVVNASVDGVTYQVVSKIPEYQITSGIDSNLLQSYLQKLDLLPLSSKEFIEYTKNGDIFTSTVRKADYKHIDRKSVV